MMRAVSVAGLLILKDPFGGTTGGSVLGCGLPEELKSILCNRISKTTLSRKESRPTYK